jgi:hypothetical protein
MYRPESSYKLDITDNPESGNFSVWFDKEPDELTASLFQSMGLDQQGDRREFKASGEKERDFAELMQRALSIGEYPKTIPYKPSRLTGEEGIDALDFSIATFQYVDIFGKEQTQEILIYERYETKRKGLAGVLAKTLFNGEADGFSVTKRPNKTKAKKLLEKDFFQTRIKEPFGFYDDSKFQLLAKSDATEKTKTSVKNSPDETEKVEEKEKSENLTLETSVLDVTPEEVIPANGVTPIEVTMVADVTPSSETLENSEIENGVTRSVDVTPLLVTPKKKVTPTEETPTNPNPEIEDKSVEKVEPNIDSTIDEKQAKVNYEFLEKLLPDLIAQTRRGVNYSESFSKKSDFQKVIFKVTDEIENDLLDISLELEPNDKKEFHHHHLTIRLNVRSKECLLTDWITIKDGQSKNRNIPLFGLTSLLNKLLSQEHLFALSEEEVLDKKEEEIDKEYLNKTSGLSSVKHIKLSTNQSEQYSQIECISWSEANDWLKEQSSPPEKSINIRFTIVWQNGILITGNFDLFSEQFHPSYEHEILQKVAIRYLLKSVYEKQISGRSIENQNFNKKQKGIDLSYLDQLDLGNQKDKHIQEYQPKIPALYVEVISKMIRTENKYESSQKFHLANEFLGILKANGNSEDKVELIMAWRDGTNLKTTVKVKSIPKNPNHFFWKTLLKSKTGVADVNSYQLSDDAPLLFDHEIDFPSPEFYFTALESAYWHHADKDTKNKLFFSGYLYHKKHLAKAIQKYLNALTEEEENEWIEPASKSVQQKKVLDFILKYKKLEADDHNLQYAQVIRLIEDASQTRIKSAQTALDGILLQFQDDGTMVSLPQLRVQNTSLKTKASGESKRIKRNREIEALIKEKGGEPLQYSEKELNLLNTYSGYGGSKLSEVNKGLLYEYYTPDEIVRLMWGFAIKHGYQSGAILEPSCGIGKFLKYAPKNSRIEAYETNQFSAQIARILYPHASIHQKSFEQLFFNGNIYLKGSFRTAPFELVIGNPPYGSFSGKYAGMGEKKRTKAFTYDQYFLTRGLDLLVSGGLLVFIIPQSFLDNNAKYNPLKERIAAKADFLEARRLPHGIFEYTDVGTDIVVFRKK